MNLSEGSFINFVYPFLFDPAAFTHHASHFESSKIGNGKHKHNVWKKYKLDTSEMLAHVAQQIQLDVEASSVRLWKINQGTLDLIAGRGMEWRLKARSNIDIPFVIKSVNLMLIRGGVGFLTINAAPQGDECSHWFNFLHYFRFINGRQRTSISATVFNESSALAPLLRFADGDNNHSSKTVSGAKSSNGKHTFDEVVSALLHTGSLVAPDKAGGEKWWREVFIQGQMLPFAVLLFDDVVAGDEPQTIYRVRNLFGEHQELHPAHSDLQLDHDSLMEYASRQWFVFTLDGGAFVGFDAPRDRANFFRGTLLDHLRDQYFVLYQFALYQRFALISMSAEVAKNWVGISDKRKQVARRREETFQHIRDNLMEFTARGLFTHIMQREHHHRVYRKWQEVFQVRELYGEVRDEVQEMHNYLMMQRSDAEEWATQKIQWLIGSLGVASIVISFLGINLQGITVRAEGLPFWVAVLMALEGTVELGIPFALAIFLAALVLRRLRNT